MRRSDRLVSRLCPLDIEGGFRARAGRDFVIPPSTTILLDYSAIKISITGVEQLRIPKTIWRVRTIELGNFLEFSKLPAERDASHISEASIPVNRHSETRYPDIKWASGVLINQL